MGFLPLDGKEPLAGELQGEAVVSIHTAPGLMKCALGALLLKEVPDPELNPEEYHSYDMNRWSGRWWKLERISNPSSRTTSSLRGGAAYSAAQSHSGFGCGGRYPRPTA
jgi:hypothetical protein